MFELISMERGDFWISSVNLVKMLKDSGIADKQHYNVLADIDRMYETNQRMVAKYGGVNADGSRKREEPKVGRISENRPALNLQGGSQVPGMYQSTYTDQQNQERRCWMLDEHRTIQLCAGYSEEIRWFMTESGCELELLHVVDEDVEYELHTKFKHIRHHGEWFYDDGQIREFICSEYQ